jgi:YVTN family beta-propeller protein
MPAYAVAASDLDAYNLTTYAPAGTGILSGTGNLGVNLSPAGDFAYTTDPNTGDVNRVNTSTFTVTSVTLPTTAGNGPRACVVSPDNTRLYVTSRGDNEVFVLNAATLATITTFPILHSPTDIVVTPDGGHLYIAQETNTSVAVVETVGFTTTATITVGNDPNALDINLAGTFVYCGNLIDGSVSVIATASNTVVATIPPPVGGLDILSLKASADGKYVYASAGFSTDAWRITTASNTVTDHFMLGSDGQGVAITPDSTAAWFAEPGATQIEVWSVPGDTLVHTIGGVRAYDNIAIFVPPRPTSPSYPGGQFIPKLFIPQKGKVNVDYTADELRANWLAIEIWSQRWLPPPTTALLFPHKNDPTKEGVNANWITLEVWGQVLKNLGAPYTPLFVPRKPSVNPEDLDIAFLAVQNWANRLPL